MVIFHSCLLRVVRQREERNIGANRIAPADVRIICATNRDLSQMIAQNKNREDLYYSFNVLSINLPPLRERGGDIGLMMRHYLTYYGRRFGKGMIGLTAGARAAADAYAWPGNVREIRNVSEQLAVLCEGDTVSTEDILAVLPVRRKATAPVAPEADAGINDASLRDLTRRRIVEVLERARSRQEAAELLGISKTTLWRKCKEYGLL